MSGRSEECWWRVAWVARIDSEWRRQRGEAARGGSEGVRRLGDEGEARTG